MTNREPNSDDRVPNPHIVGQGWRVPATYRAQNIPDYQGHPYIEALPPILTKQLAGKLLGLFPRYDEEHRHALDEERFHLIQSGMKFFTPLPVHQDLEQRISRLIRGGYVSRHPLKPNYWLSIDAAWKAMTEGTFPHTQTWSTAAGMTIIGMSGMGKTTTTERILNTYPQVIIHSNYQGQSFTQSQVVWLKLECPYDGEPRGVCINFFQMMDKILGTHYCDDYVKRSRPAKVMLPDMANVASLHGLGVLIIDEIQRLSHSRSGGAGMLLDFVGQLINTIGVPVLVIGTFKARAILTREVRQIRRGTGQGDLIWNPMKEDAVWRHFVESLWKYQYTRVACPLTEELRNALYVETQGITDFAVKVYMLAQIRAITSKKEIVNVDVIKSVAQDSLQTAAPVLKALKMNDNRVLAKYEDVPKIDFEEIIKRELSRELPSPPVDENNGIEGDKQEQGTVVSAAQENVTNEDASPTTNPSTQEAVTTSRTRRVTRRRGLATGSTPKGHLPKVVSESEMKHHISPYEALKRAGFIRHSSEFLTAEGAT
jgi:AAA domain